MEEHSPSRTAEDMAGFRAIETLRPKADRACEDPFAKHFLTGAWATRFKSPFRSKIFIGITHLVNPGAANTVPIRLRFIDDYINASVPQGLEQLVILGAGYDCRALRMEALQKGVMVFEVDHPATQEYKKRVLATLLDEIPEHVVFIPSLVEEAGFGQALLEHGYDPGKKSLFIMEGLVMYLAPDSVKELFTYISSHSAPGSAVIFDYLPPGIEDGTVNHRGGKNMHKWAIRKGEPFRFGIDKERLPQFLAEAGFDNVKIVTAEACRDRYFNGNNRDRCISALFSFAHATVNKN